MFVLKSTHELESKSLREEIARLHRMLYEQAQRHDRLLQHFDLGELHEEAKPPRTRLVPRGDAELVNQERRAESYRAFRESAQQNGMNFGFYRKEQA